MPFRQHGDELAVGPCIVAVDAVKEKVDLSYAKFVFDRPALQAEAVLSAIIEFKKSTLDRAVDLKKTRTTLDEAVRVSLARKSKPAKGNIYESNYLRFFESLSSFENRWRGRRLQKSLRYPGSLSRSRPY